MLRRMSLRLRLNAIFGLLLLAALAASLAALGLKAGPRVSAEDDSTMRLSREVVETAIESLKATPDPEKAIAALARGLSNLRHVQVSILRPGGQGEASPRPVPREGQTSVPRWFAELVAPATETVLISVDIAGRHFGDIAIASNPWDEVAEIWETAITLLAGGLGLVLVVTCLNHWIVGRSLRPIADIERVVAGLAGGDYAIRPNPVGPPEFVAIGEGLTALASALEKSRRENRSLAQRLVSAQDDERKQIAHELHDEFGPCLFAIRAHASALLARARKTGAPDAEVEANCAAVLEQTAALQKLNRRVLASLRPDAWSDLGLAEALNALVAMWRSSAPGVNIDMNLSASLADLDETVGLTLYRVVQESLTNVFRHAGATRVEIRIEDRDGAPVAPGAGARGERVLLVRVADDGGGAPDETVPGFGLRGMAERVLALAGDIVTGNAPGGGFVVEVRLPRE